MNQLVNIPPQVSREDGWAWGIAALALVIALKVHLLPALIAGLLVYELVNLLVPLLRVRALGHEGPRRLAVALIAFFVIAMLALAGFGVSAFFRHSDQSVPALLVRAAEIIEHSRERLPSWLLTSLPTDAEELRLALVEWLRDHAGSVQVVGKEAGRTLAHILIGMVIGALLSLEQTTAPNDRRPLYQVIAGHAARLSTAFRRVVFAQFWISSINTFLTWCYIGLILPLCGVELPLTKTLVAVTFFGGMIPILGNLMSNSLVFIVSLSVSPTLGLVSLIYLVAIHKLEYFLNARIVGSHIHARAWELLTAMLVMEALFGLPGVVAAPIFYAYFKDEFRSRNLV